MNHIVLSVLIQATQILVRCNGAKDWFDVLTECQKAIEGLNLNVSEEMISFAVDEVARRENLPDLFLDDCIIIVG